MSSSSSTTDNTKDADVAAAIRELAKQVDAHGNAVFSAAGVIAEAIKSSAGSQGSQISDRGTFT